MLKKNFFLFIALGIASICEGQIGLPKVVPPSPEAAAFARYADVPVSLYTGMPQIAVPLYNLQCGNLSIPISLSYNATGVKVEEPSRSMGMGWVLNSGGSVSRSIRGKPDPYQSSNLPRTTPYIGDPTIADFDMLANQANTNADFEPDIFYFNFNGYSGSFYINGNKVVFSKYEDIKVEFQTYQSADNIIGITITVIDGTKYYFLLPFSGANAPATTEWFLTKIVNADNTRSIFLDYDVNGNYYIIPPKNSKYYWFNTTNTTPYLIYNAPGNNSTFGNTGPCISKIYTSAHDSIVFTPKTLLYNESVQGIHKAISTMEVYNAAKTKIKTVRFDNNNIKTVKPYNYAPPGYPFIGYDHAMDYRLYLDGVTEIGTDGQEIKHVFNYYGRTPDNYDSLPNALSCAQDMGGFYNGIDANQSLNPTFIGHLDPFFTSNIFSPCVDERHPVDIVTIPGANRDPDFNYMLYGTLRSVTYPTGGKTEFSFSQLINPEGDVPFYGFKLDALKYYDQNGTLIKRKHYEYSQGTLGHDIPPFLTYAYYWYDQGSLATFPDCTGSPTPGTGDIFPYKTAVEIHCDNAEDLGTFEGPLIGYGHVEEIEDGNGKTVYEYKNDQGYYEALGHHVTYINRNPTWNIFNAYGLDIGDFWPLGPYPNNSWTRGPLLRKSVYSESGQLLQETENHYSFLELETIPALKSYTVIPYIYRTDQHAINGSFLYYQYNIKGGWVRLDGVTETMNNVTTTTSYEYLASNHKQVTKQTRYGSDQASLTTEYKYPNDFSYSEPYATMMSRHTISPVIQKVEKKGNNATMTTKNNWGFFQSNSIIAPRSVESQNGTNPSESRSIYADYDTFGNLTKVSKAGGSPVSYLYGYDGSYPVAEVINAPVELAAYTGFEEAIDEDLPNNPYNWDVASTRVSTDAKAGHYSCRVGGAPIYCTNEEIPPAVYKISLWSKNGTPYVGGGSPYGGGSTVIATTQGITDSNGWTYREYTIQLTVTGVIYVGSNALNNDYNVLIDELRLYPTGAQMTTYTYDPLIGMTSATDPKGLTTYYEYDSFQRLMNIKDQNGKILKHIDYHYQGQ